MGHSGVETDAEHCASEGGGRGEDWAGHRSDNGTSNLPAGLDEDDVGAAVREHPMLGFARDGAREPETLDVFGQARGRGELVVDGHFSGLYPAASW